jgi:integrase
MGLSDLAVRKAMPRPKPYHLVDGKGLSLSVTPSGGKLWRWRYRFGGHEKLMALGKYPEITLAMARERLSEGRKQLAVGVDPMAQRKVDKTEQLIASAGSFSNVSALWLDHWRDDKSHRHVETTRRRLETNVLPCLGALQTADIQAPDIVAMVKTIEARGARNVAKRAHETTGQIFRYAIAHGYAKRNPATDIRPRDILKSSPKTNMARIEAKELCDLLRQIEVYPGTHVTRLAIKLIALTFVRTSELIEAKWPEFDLEAGRWDIPAKRMNMRTPHIVPLARQAVEVLQMLRQLTGHRDWVFPGDLNPSRPMSNNTILKGLERMGYKGRMTGHGFRGLASTILHEQGYPHDHIELQLAHSPRNAVSAAYNHALYLAPRAKMMQDWADYLEQTQRAVKTITFRDREA